MLWGFRVWTCMGVTRANWRCLITRGLGVSRGAARGVSLGERSTLWEFCRELVCRRRESADNTQTSTQTSTQINRPVAVVAADAPSRTKPSVYPEPFASMMVGREKAAGRLLWVKQFWSQFDAARAGRDVGVAACA